MRDVRRALRELHSHYNRYCNKIEEAREWVKQYLWSNLKGQFLNLIRPSTVFFGPENKVTAEYIMTSDRSLYDKYVKIRDTGRIIYGENKH